MRNAVRLSMILAGFTAMASQIIYVRELLIVFYGNELSISFILSSWLISGAIGSALLGRFSGLVKQKIPVFSFCQIILAILLPAGILAARFIKSALHINPGEVLPLFPIMALSFLILMPICAMLGFMFSLGCRIYGSGSGKGAVRIGNVYILEAAGSLIGGALTSVILIKLFAALDLMWLLSILNIFAAFILAIFAAKTPAKKAVIRSALTLLFFFVLIWYVGIIRQVNEYSLRKQWQGYDLIASKNSIYGNIAIAKKEESYSFFDNGLHLYTVPDRMNSEEAAHLALLEHPNPEKVLLIGGGAGGLAGEILKEPVKSLDYVELDPVIISMARDHLPDNYYDALKDKRVSIKNTDGRFFVKTTKEKYDCVIVRVGDPYTSQINRYYTVEFFKEVKNILNDGGVLSFGLTSSESYISRPLGEFISSIYLSLKDVFKDVLVMPGETAYLISSDRQDYLTYDYDILEKRTRERSLDTKYVREYYLFSKLSAQNLSYIKSVIDTNKAVRLNHDFTPSTYYYGLIFWATLFKDSILGKLLASLNERVLWEGMGIFLAVLILALAALKRSFKRAALTALAIGGFSTMAFQILLLLAFQIIHGYLFYKLGIILTAFMAGLAAGAIFAVRIIERLGKERTFLLAVQGDLLIYSIILPVFFLRSGSDILFPVMSVLAGFIGGSQFPLVNRILLIKGGEPGRLGGLTYGVDLFGSFFGALLTGVLFVPILGIVKTCIAIAIINLAMLGLLAFNVSIEE